MSPSVSFPASGLARLYDALKPALFTLPPETAHGLGHAALRVAQDTPVAEVMTDRLTVDDPRLETTAFGQSFPNPVGVAAGFDKNAEIPAALAALGFGHVEVGGVTAERQPGNPRPRMFRLLEDGEYHNVHVNLHEDELAVAGMEIGDEVFVRVRDGKIIIQKADPDEVEHEF